MGTVFIFKNLIFTIHTNDHGFPHVTVYLGNPKSYEAKAKVRLDKVEMIASEGFSYKALKQILEITNMYSE